MLYICPSTVCCRLESGRKTACPPLRIHPITGKKINWHRQVPYVCSTLTHPIHLQSVPPNLKICPMQHIHLLYMSVDATAHHGLFLSGRVSELVIRVRGNKQKCLLRCYSLQWNTKPAVWETVRLWFQENKQIRKTKVVCEAQSPRAFQFYTKGQEASASTKFMPLSPNR